MFTQFPLQLQTGGTGCQHARVNLQGARPIAAARRQLQRLLAQAAVDGSIVETQQPRITTGFQAGLQVQGKVAWPFLPVQRRIQLLASEREPGRQLWRPGKLRRALQ